MNTMFTGGRRKFRKYYTLTLVICGSMLLYMCATNDSSSLGKKGKTSPIEGTHLGLRIEFRTGSQVFQWGEPIELEVALCNRGEQAVSITPLLWPQDYFLRLSVKDSAGNVLRFIGPERRMKLPQETSLTPGDCLRELFDLNTLFQFPQAGEFTVEASYWDNLVEPNNSKIDLRSNRLTFKIEQN